MATKFNSPRRQTRRAFAASVGALALAGRSWSGALLAPSVSAQSPIGLTPALDEGDAYIDVNLEQGDLALGVAGVPMSLSLMVMDLSTTQAFAGAVVDVWQANAEGTFSLFDGSTDGDAYLRGYQIADANGLVEFASIVPGWTDGRAPVAYVKIWQDGDVLLTTQLFVPDEVADSVALMDPYTENPSSKVALADDPVIATVTDPSLVTLAMTGDAASGYTATATIGVDLSSVAGG